MIALTTVDNVGAASLRRDGIRTGLAMMTVPLCWCSSWSILSARTSQRIITQYSIYSVPRLTDSLYRFIAVAYESRHFPIEASIDVSLVEWICWRVQL